MGDVGATTQKHPIIRYFLLKKSVIFFSRGPPPDFESALAVLQTQGGRTPFWETFWNLSVVQNTKAVGHLSFKWLPEEKQIDLQWIALHVSLWVDEDWHICRIGIKVTSKDRFGLVIRQHWVLCSRLECNKVKDSTFAIRKSPNRDTGGKSSLTGSNQAVSKSKSSTV